MSGCLGRGRLGPVILGWRHPVRGRAGPVPADATSQSGRNLQAGMVPTRPPAGLVSTKREAGKSPCPPRKEMARPRWTCLPAVVPL